MEIQNGDLVSYHGRFINSCLSRFVDTPFRVLRIKKDKQKVQCCPLGSKGYFWFSIHEVKKIPF